jgi:hypothetical protein
MKQRKCRSDGDQLDRATGCTTPRSSRTKSSLREVEKHRNGRDRGQITAGSPGEKLDGAFATQRCSSTYCYIPTDNLINRFVKKKSITVTEASRKFADCVNRAHYQNVTFVLLKNSKPFARLVPDNEKVCVGRDLAEALAKTNLQKDEARRWHSDLNAARKTLKAPSSRWR